MQDSIDYGMLNTQTDERFGNRPYGRFGTIAKNGCGMIALYNIERAADGKTMFEPFYEARKRIRTNFFGLLGTRPSSIGKNLKSRGFGTVRIRLKKAGEAAPFDGVIVLYWHFFGAHYVAGIGNADGTYTFYNQFQTPYAMKLDDFLQYLRKNKLHPVRAWGIRFPRKPE
ncbi:MAG: hypothetical protein IJL62_07465 [Clostridia bacterium]|nr:hypothetical protein [Clostridia bacterium]